MDSRVWQATVRGVAKVGHDLTTKERERDFNDWGFPGGSVCKESACDEGDHLQCRRPGFISWVGKIPWRRKWPPTPVFLPGKLMDRGAWRATDHRVTGVRQNLVTKPPVLYL